MAHTTNTTGTKVCYLSIGALGTGFLEASLRRGLEGQVDFIGADAGSTDGGPNALAGGRWTNRQQVSPAHRQEMAQCRFHDNHARGRRLAIQRAS